MERLTIRNSDGSVSQPTSTTIQAVFEKLAAYEDLEEQGRLIVLPCKVGDVLWRIESVCYADKCPPYADDCDCIHCTRKKEKVIAPIKMLSPANIVEWSKNIGVDLFLTRAEAEAAMKGVSEDA